MAAHGKRRTIVEMLRRAVAALLHLSMLALVAAIATYWAIRILTPAPAAVPPPLPAAALREADPTLAARMFGLVQATPVLRQSLNIEAVGAYAAGRDSAAVLAVDGKPARVYLLDQEVVAGARLVEVRSDAVLIEQAGVRREFALPEPAKLGVGGQPPPAGYTRDGITLTAPTVASGAQPAMPPVRPPPPRPPVAQPQFAPQPVQPSPVPQPEQGEPPAEDSNEGGVRRQPRALAQ
jgi:general secretion pathway protein C